MPIIDGKVVRARITGLRLDELSSVDRPAQHGAVATIIKRKDAMSAHDTFAAKVAAIAKRDGIPEYLAMSKARRENPAEFDAMQEADVSVAKAMEPEPIEPPVFVNPVSAAFVAKAHTIAEAERIPLHMAMSAARSRHPDLLA